MLRKQYKINLHKRELFILNEDMRYGDDYKYIPSTAITSGSGIEVLPDLYHYTIQIVNIQLVGDPSENEFVLIDAGMPKSANKIISLVENRFGEMKKPQAIILTHGHFDHVGGIIELINYWDIPVFAHELEIPYLTGKKGYLEPDPTVEGGLLAKISPFFPNDPINLANHVQVLPKDGSVPYLPEFKWIHTPGHSPGHISLFRQKDRTLIVGDAFVTVKQDELYKVLTQKQEISGPPRYLTTDWEAAKQSVEKLAMLRPKVAVTGHGLPMNGQLLNDSLTKLVTNFDTIAKPNYGKYLH